MIVLYLVRHAHANWSPDEERTLSARGYANAERVGTLLCGFPIVAVYSSPYRRARETVEPLAAHLGLPIYEIDNLRERELGTAPTDSFVTAVQATWEDPSFTWPGGESNTAAQRRGVAVVHDLLDRHPEQQVAIGTHGNLLALILQHFDPSVGFSFWRSLTMPDVYGVRVNATTAVVQRLWQ
jgi:2,3-bisphosphoglycerate-dependent phosphoglycerate mutase